MKLYLDAAHMAKAVSQMGAGVDTPTEDQSTAEYDSSYSRRYEGVAAGEAMDPDDPDEGGTYPHADPANSSVEQTKQKQKERTKQAQSEGLVKSLAILKSFNTNLEDEHRRSLPNEVEVDFLVLQGYTEADINKGLITMNHRMRTQFTEWLCSRLATSVDDIIPGR